MLRISDLFLSVCFLSVLQHSDAFPLHQGKGHFPAGGRGFFLHQIENHVHGLHAAQLPVQNDEGFLRPFAIEYYEDELDSFPF